MKKGILASTLIFFTLLSSYVILIPGIELFSRTDFIESLALFDYGNSTSVMEFQVGDTLVVVAEVKGGANAISSP